MDRFDCNIVCATYLFIINLPFITKCHWIFVVLCSANQHNKLEINYKKLTLYCNLRKEKRKVMVIINSTNTNKTNNHLSPQLTEHKIWKESLYSDGHQFHQYQQNVKSPLILTELTEHKTDHDIWRCKSRTWLGADRNMWRG